MNSDSKFGGSESVVSSHSVFGAPCWVSLTSRDLPATENFYAAVLGWRWRTAKLGDHFRIALADGVPVAGIAGVASLWQMAVAWTPYFAVSDADAAASRARERGGTVAVGPLSFPPGRAALLADRHGASFGIWEGALFTDWETWRKAAPAFIRLHTRDAFDAAIFYGEVLEWATEKPGCCEVHYEGNEVVLRSEGEAVARITSGALEAAPDPTIRPHWQVHFSVSDVAARVEAAQHHGGTILTHDAREAVLRDPDGAQFTITSRTAR
ncbi:VOC family protein [Streptomyces europaeiscabiei]|uniref:VOC family protein n=1 Tax=Streptomyces europaeiscabiei TaxID=146819 RepID=A0ABU4NF06_9ACTN|nr:VOC family protein [Streptomyces europaeiscabiei]MDX2529610.1 VOC family protein [Streptomyces europaeiscabiei]MDX2761295.1 VOC family protein [Streptomyces europaeiscabiei]MDX2770700.1 VOC family protein [Streptomyces europaeiscabiei]MDX3544338.1 VOC family protein [Streptomyces europaeiscabiei]MDX3552572.1 VOC family protein [Streptomyces europaeiscabiei]